MKSFQEKLKAAQAELISKGIAKAQIGSPAERLLWTMGAEVRPLYYAGFRRNAWAMGLLIACFWGLAMHFVVWRDQGIGWQSQVINSCMLGVVGGLGIAFLIHYRTKGHKLTPWDDL